MYRVTYLDIKHGTRHLVRVNAPTAHIAERNAWDVFVLLREQHRYGTPLKEDFALYSIVEGDDAAPEEYTLESYPPDPRDA